MKKQHSLWVESFRPTTLNDYLCDDDLKNKLQSFIDKNDIPNCIFAGTAGLGKSTLAKLLVKNIKCDYLYLNASDENGIDVIRDKVKQFASSATFQPIKIVILEEASFLTQPAQEALKQIIEDYSLNTRFIFTCNYLEKITEPIQSRCKGNIFIFKGIPKSQIAKYICEHILDVENINYQLKDIVKIINDNYPDIRAIVSHLQSCVKDNKIVYTELNTDYFNDIIKLLKKPTKNSWVDIRQIIANAQLDDFQPLIEHLYEHIDEYSKNNEAEIIIELDEMQWRSRMVPDKEIAAMALFSKLLKLLTNKTING